MENEEIVGLLKEILKNQQAGLALRTKATRTLRLFLVILGALLVIVFAIQFLITPR
jgi:hypothetical protein